MEAQPPSDSHPDQDRSVVLPARLTPEQVRRISGSPAWNFYRRRFFGATAMPIRLFISQAESSPCGSTRFCRLLNATSRNGAVDSAPNKALPDDPSPCSLLGGACPAGLRTAAAPIRIGARTLGSLAFGPFSTSPITPREAARRIADLPFRGSREVFDDLVEALLLTPVVSPNELKAAETLLRCFSRLFSARINAMLVADRNDDPSWANEIRDRLRRGNPLRESPSPLLDSRSERAFHRLTGLSFSDYRRRWRLETACARLLDPLFPRPLVAAESGYRSETAMREALQQLLGDSPDRYRQRMRRLDRELALWPKPFPGHSARLPGETRL